MNVPTKLRRFGLLAAAIASFALLFAAAAAPAPADFGLNSAEVRFVNEDGSTATQAGSHPFAMEARFGVNYTELGFFEGVLHGEVKDAAFEQVAGLIGNATAVPTCTTGEFLFSVGGTNECAKETQVGDGIIGIAWAKAWEPVQIVNLEPPPGMPVRFGFTVVGVHVVVDIGVKQGGEYNVVASQTDLPSQITPVFGAMVSIWGNPGETCGGEVFFNQGESSVSEVDTNPKSCPAKFPNPKPLLTLPTSCTGPAAGIWRADSWQNPGTWVEGILPTNNNLTPPTPQGFTGCGKLNVAPSVSAKSTTNSAETGSGLDVSVNFDDGGLVSPQALAQSTIKKAVVTLPEGVTINPSVGEGLGVCTPADLERETLHSIPGEGCPNASKLGTLHIDTPLIGEGVEGSVFLAQQDDPTTTTPGAENPFDSLIALYLVLRNENLGVIVKQAAEVVADPKTGQLVTTLDDIPQLPFSHFNFHFREGQRAPLVTPPACGTYTSVAKFYPRSDPDNPRTVLSDFEIKEGVNEGPCPPAGIPPFHPDFEAGAINNNAGSFSPFNMRLIRGDGEQDMTKFSSVLPPGELGSLKGVSKCPDAAIDIAKAKSGREELASPTCPANSLIGHTLAGAGVGSALTYVGGQIYLGGPYKGDPLSVISVTPAVAGPFDAGTVVVRLALNLNPKTAEVEVDGANSDPIPHILKGIVLKVRDLRVYVDRPNFTLNPTSCNESSAKATLFGSYLDVFNPADDVPVHLSTRYQAANCLNLGFKPKLDLKLNGGTKRGGHPGLTATYKPRQGDANVKGLVVRLPRSAFLDQGHIRTICTRVQFAAKACPPAAQYGYIRAWTPLLDNPLEGPVWLRSSNHKLPDLVFDLHGLVDVEVATRIDSAQGGIRASVESAPDAPLTKVVVRMQGGKKGLIINSRNLCGATSKADVRFNGHNGKRFESKPVMRPDCGGKRKGKRAR